MKKIALVFTGILILLSLFAYSRVHILPRSKRYGRLEEKDRGGILSRIARQNAKIKQLLKKNSNRLNFWDNTLAYDIATGETLIARLLSPVISSNLDSPILLEATNDSLLPQGTRFACTGEEKTKRVHITCNLMILSKSEHIIKAQALNLDGSAGIRGIIYTGNDQKIAGSLSATLLKGLAKTPTRGIPNEIARIIRKNVNERQKTIIQIHAGTPVLIYFNKRFKR